MTASATDSRTGASVLAQAITDAGVTHVFMVPAIARRTMAELERTSDVARVTTHSEQAAAYMADGYARSSGRIGLCAAQHVGGLNLAAGLRDAWLAHSPVIALSGGTDPATRGSGVYQESDNGPAFSSVTKLSVQVPSAARILELWNLAARTATSGCPGPVHLELAGNEGQVDAEVIDGPERAGPATVPAGSATGPGAADDELRAQLDALATAARPILVAGGGARRAGAGPALSALAERLDIPIVSTPNGRDSVDESHPLWVGVSGSYGRRSAAEALRAADLVCFVGSSAGAMTTSNWSAPPESTRVLQIDVDPSRPPRRYPQARTVTADARLALERMLALLPEQVRRTAWVAQCRDLARTPEPPGEGPDGDDLRIRPDALCRELSDCLPEDAVVVVDTGHAGMWMNRYFDLRSTGQQFLRSAGHLGWALPAGIGAKAANPALPQVTMTGDAGFLYHLAELETAVRWNIATVVVINDNDGGTQSQRGFDTAYGGAASLEAQRMWRYAPIDLVAAAESMGAWGRRVERRDDIAPAVAAALAAGVPAVLDVRTNPQVRPRVAW